MFKLEMEHPGKGKGLSEYNVKTREIEMEHEVKRLKQVHTQHTHACSSVLMFSLYIYSQVIKVCFNMDHTDMRWNLLETDRYIGMDDIIG